MASGVGDGGSIAQFRVVDARVGSKVNAGIVGEGQAPCTWSSQRASMALYEQVQGEVHWLNPELGHSCGLSLP